MRTFNGKYTTADVMIDEIEPTAAVMYRVKPVINFKARK